MPSSAIAYHQNSQFSHNPPLDLLAYKVQPGDTVSEILVKHYNTPVASPDYQRALLSLQYINPEVTNINDVYPGQVIRLMPLAPQKALAYCPIPRQQSPDTVDREAVLRFMRENPKNLTDLSHYQRFWPRTAEEQHAFWLLTMLEEHYGLFSVSAAAGFNSFDRLVSAPNNTLLADVKFHYRQFQDGKISRNQYNYRRQQALNLYSQKLGPFEKLVLNGKTSQEAIRISRAKAIPATAKIDKQLSRLSTMAKLSKHGGILLTGAGLGVGCYQIANAQDRQRKNEIFVETMGSTLFGAVATVGITVLLASNPVGWGVALVLGTSSAIASYGIGKGAAWVYDKSGSKTDIVKFTKVDKICK